MSATLDTPHAGDHHEDHGHSHMPFQAHHFDDPEQQYDSGKLGIWLFLVTEVLFFSGMFCAYALYRSLHPEVFSFASQFLNTKLGAFNTGVLLFSSLTMAWAVRCAQTRQRTGLIVNLSITLGCATIFLGVKAIEYSHKWDMGLLVAGYYQHAELHGVHHEGLSKWLVIFSIIPGLAVAGLATWYFSARAKNDKASTEIAGPFLVTALCYFVGVGIGMMFEGGGHEAAKPEAAAHASEHPSADQHSAHGEAELQPGTVTTADIDQRGKAGIFFSIYYCMTGVHALHIIGGIIVLGWLLVRATKDHFNEQYFGPVDYVGLYWHIVDLIWIYLFPLLYLIK